MTNRKEAVKRAPVKVSGLGFIGGLMTGAALSSLVPWAILESIAPGTRLACLAGLGAGFVTFRILAARRRLRTATGIGSVVVGGFLLSLGPRFSALGVDVFMVEFGAVSFLCGLTLLYRCRNLSPEEREQAVELLLDDSGDDKPPPSADSLRRAEALRCLEQPFVPESIPNVSQAEDGEELVEAFNKWQGGSRPQLAREEISGSFPLGADHSRLGG